MAKKQATVWNNRIVGTAEVAPDQLIASALNFRRHPKEQSAALSGLIAEVGFLDPILVQAGTDRVLDGHLRVELAMREGQPTIPVQYVDLTDAEADLVLATFDPISELAYRDQENLDELLAIVDTQNADVQALLDSLTAPDFDANAEWQGMPAFENEDQTPAKAIVVNFASESDVEAFARLTQQNVTMSTKSVWFPFKPKSQLTDITYASDADAA